MTTTPDTSSAATARAVERARTTNGAVGLKDESNADTPKLEGTVSVFTLDAAALARVKADRAARTSSGNRGGKAADPAAVEALVKVAATLFPRGTDYGVVTGADVYRDLIAATDGKVPPNVLRAACKRLMPWYRAHDAASVKYGRAYREGRTDGAEG